MSAGSTALTTGQVNFCDATAKRCRDIHLLGTAQLTSAGTAVLKLRPGVGNRNFTAVFLGTNHYAASVSGTSALNVAGTTGTYVSATTMAEIGGWGAYAEELAESGFCLAVKVIPLEVLAIPAAFVTDSTESC